MTTYIKKTWLSEKSDSTSSVVAYCGKVKYRGKMTDDAFIEIADCRHKINLHITPDETKEDFINKIKLLRNEIEEFINHLKTLNPAG
jgi:hypothetical protein